ncbi:hypothetical protein FOL47_003909 [Perkinsus chesapeaki]|uniref:Adenylosuccinate lyase n=1 Tax=Perkinsus chesapeaki TaxID=330153 RepID=A0A7J6M5E1_PERCH|nr:hypothetical protein FOL47_003909 [Perkinsus chesapeaki]
MEVESRQNLSSPSDDDLAGLVSSMKHRDLVAVVQGYVRSCGEEERLQVAKLAGIPVHVPEDLASDTVMHASAEEEREAEMDQYADKGVETSEESEPEAGGLGAMDDQATMMARAKWVPIRLTYDERKLLRLVESAMQVADYTDKVDVQFPPNVSPARQMAIRARQMCAILNGLVVAEDYSKGAALVKSRDYAAYGDFYRKAFEISRRYKLLNPERMRSTYGKLIYFLMDTVRPDTVGLFEHIGVIEPVKTVYSTLQSSPRALKMLDDPLLEVATREIYSEGRSRGEVQRDIKAVMWGKKENAIRKLSRKYCAKGTQRKKNKGHFGGYFSYMFSGRTDEDSSDGDDNALDSEEVEGARLTQEDIEQCIYALGDHSTYLRFNRLPCDRMIQYMQHYFSPDRIDMDVTEQFNVSLAIQEGNNGSRLTHSHARQYNFVLQSLTLWREVISDMYRLWHLAEEDLLDPTNPYTLQQTGQGLHRVQKSPKVMKAMRQIVARVQRQLGDKWIGSTIVHLGDHNVPNALMFIDKYVQVPRILGPLVLCLDKIAEMKDAPGMSNLVKNFGGVENLHRIILSDFFRHAFDGSGGDNFFDAGSCIDGRLTSAWNWCSQIEDKPYFPVFLLTGFTGFDGTDLNHIFSEFGLIRQRVRVEVEWLTLMSDRSEFPEVPSLTPEQRNKLGKIASDLTVEDGLRVKEIERTTNHDVKAVEYLIKEKLHATGDPTLAKLTEFTHFACTSEDINNLSYALMFTEARSKVLRPRFISLINKLAELSQEYADTPLLALTHGQPATPTTFGKECAVFVHRLKRQLRNLDNVEVMGKFNGATANYNAHIIAYPDVDWFDISRTLVEDHLGLNWQPVSTQIESHDYVSELCDTVARMNTIMIDMCRDFWMYIMRGVLGLRTIAGEVGSSTMPHKVNPIDFENAEGNCGVAISMLHHFSTKLPISRMQRDLTDSTVQRAVGSAFAHTIIAIDSTIKGLSKVMVSAPVAKRELDEHWAVTGEAVQTLMRRYGLERPYERLKEFTRGREIDEAAMREFTENIAREIGEDKPGVKGLENLTPQTYIGLAPVIARKYGTPVDKE